MEPAEGKEHGGFDAAAVRRQFLRKGGQDGPVECDCLPPQYGVGIRPFSPFFVGGFHD